MDTVICISDYFILDARQVQVTYISSSCVGVLEPFMSCEIKLWDREKNWYPEDAHKPFRYIDELKPISISDMSLTNLGFHKEGSGRWVLTGESGKLASWDGDYLVASGNGRYIDTHGIQYIHEIQHILRECNFCV